MTLATGGSMTEREAFESWAKEKGIPFHWDAGTQEYSLVAWQTWQAAVAHERERHRKQLAHQQASYEAEIKIEVEAERARCAKVCDAIAHDWRGANSQSVQCADAIRKEPT